MPVEVGKQEPFLLPAQRLRTKGNAFKEKRLGIGRHCNQASSPGLCPWTLGEQGISSRASKRGRVTECDTGLERTREGRLPFIECLLWDL